MRPREPAGSGRQLADARALPNHAGRADIVAAQSASIRWSYATGAGALGGPVITAASLVIAAGSDGFAYAVTPTGVLAYRYQLSGPSGNVPAVNANGIVHAPTDNGILEIFRVNGVYYDRRTFGGASMTSPAIGRGWYEQSFFVGGGAAQLMFDGGWMGADSGVTTAPAIGAHGTIYFGSYGGFLYADWINPHVSPTSATEIIERWRIDAGHPIQGDPALSASGTIYLPATDGTLLAIRPSGLVLWKRALGPGLGSPAIDAEGTVHVATRDSLWALNPDGTTAWKVDGAFHGSIPSVGGDGTVYLGVDGASLAAVSPMGVQRFVASPPGSVSRPVALPQPAIAADSTVVFVAGGGIHAVGP